MQVSVLRKKRLKRNSHSHEAWHPRSISTSGAGSGASQSPPATFDGLFLKDDIIQFIYDLLMAR